MKRIIRPPLLMMQYNSITTPNIQHDEANLLVELIWLNRNLASDIYPWRGANSKEWGRLVAIFKKLMGPSFELAPEQLAFYIYKCQPQNINSEEFAKMAIVAKKLFRKFDLEEVCRLYSDKRHSIMTKGLEHIPYKKEKSKSLLAFLRELERDETKK